MNSYLPFPLKYRVQTPSLVCSKCLIDVNSPNYFFIIINFSSYDMLWYYDLPQMSLVCLEKFSSFKIWLQCHFPWECHFYPFCPGCPLSTPQKGYLFFFCALLVFGPYIYYYSFYCLEMSCLHDIPFECQLLETRGRILTIFAFHVP